MWIMSKIGFFSCVEKPVGTICIRSRKRQDLSALKLLFGTSAPIIKTIDADYRYRILISRQFFEEQFVKLARLVDYSNFKDAVKKINPARAELYHHVWVDLLPIEKE